MECWIVGLSQTCTWKPRYKSSFTKLLNCLLHFDLDKIGTILARWRDWCLDLVSRICKWEDILNSFWIHCNENTAQSSKYTISDIKATIRPSHVLPKCEMAVAKILVVSNLGLQRSPPNPPTRTCNMPYACIYLKKIKIFK